MAKKLTELEIKRLCEHLSAQANEHTSFLPKQYNPLLQNLVKDAKPFSQFTKAERDILTEIISHTGFSIMEKTLSSQSINNLELFYAHLSEIIEREIKNRNSMKSAGLTNQMDKLSSRIDVLQGHLIPREMHFTKIGKQLVLDISDKNFNDLDSKDQADFITIIIKTKIDDPTETHVDKKLIKKFINNQDEKTLALMLSEINTSFDQQTCLLKEVRSEYGASNVEYFKKNVSAITNYISSVQQLRRFDSLISDLSNNLPVKWQKYLDLKADDQDLQNTIKANDKKGNAILALRSTILGIRKNLSSGKENLDDALPLLKLGIEQVMKKSHEKQSLSFFGKERKIGGIELPKTKSDVEKGLKTFLESINAQSSNQKKPT